MGEMRKRRRNGLYSDTRLRLIPSKLQRIYIFKAFCTNSFSSLTPTENIDPSTHGNANTSPIKNGTVNRDGLMNLPVEKNSKIDENSNIASNVQSVFVCDDTRESLVTNGVTEEGSHNQIDHDDVEMDDGTVHNCQCNKMHTKKLKSVGKSFR